MVPVGDKKKKKLLVICVTGIVLLILLLLGYPAAKLEVISGHYQLYGSYIILPGETAEVDEKPVRTKTRLAEYDRRGIKLTNVLYYPGLQQLAFGYIFRDDEQEKYEIALLDADGENVPGRLLVSGSERFYARGLQKLNFLPEEPLAQQAAYTILIKDEHGERIGALDFYYE
ncbi:MAG: hypothetical protein C6W59_04130 [Paenibacillaceae bacterium]|nr:MAG: hypothetical protein C6W59_04130 [Paenibacillaceae bacterium]